MNLERQLVSLTLHPGNGHADATPTSQASGVEAPTEACRPAREESRAPEDKDVFTVPTWTMHEHVNTGPRPAFLFSFTDAPVMKALDLYREDAKR